MVIVWGEIQLRFKGILGLALAGLAALAPTALPAASVTRDEFAFPTDHEVKVVVFRPDVHVGSLRVSGLDEPNADWTEAARKNIQAAMEAAGEARAANMHFLPDYEGADAELLDQYRGLFEVTAATMVQHVTLGDRLPTKLAPSTNPKAPKRYRLDWTLGEQASRLKAVTGGDYALFFFTHDAYGDGGRKVAQLLMAGLFGAYIPAGVHIGYAGLVDLSNGNIVWFNTNLAIGGDPRDAEGANKRVAQLLQGFPGRGGATAVPASPTSRSTR